MIVFGIAWKYTAFLLWPKLNILSMTCYFVFATLVHQNSNPGHGVIKVRRAHFWSQTHFDKITHGLSLTFTSSLLVSVSLLQAHVWFQSHFYKRNIVKVRQRPKVISSNLPDFSFFYPSLIVSIVVVLFTFFNMWYNCFILTMTFTASCIARDAPFGFKIKQRSNIKNSKHLFETVYEVLNL